MTQLKTQLINVDLIDINMDAVRQARRKIYIYIFEHIYKEQREALAPIKLSM